VQVLSDRPDLLQDNMMNAGTNRTAWLHRVLSIHLHHRLQQKAWQPPQDPAEEVTEPPCDIFSQPVHRSVMDLPNWRR
jgi:hypothetical protein